MNIKIANKIYDILAKEYPGVTTALRYKNVLELLVSTILSAQCTDERVNKVTKKLFKEYKNPADYARVKSSVFEKEIRSCGFYKNKTKSILSAAKMIITDFNGKVPGNMEDLVKLPGVARKTANIILFHGFGKNEGIAVDTHVRRLSARLGFTNNEDPVKIEQDLVRLFERTRWGYLSDLLIAHGRKICIARKPLCPRCALNSLCPSYRKFYPATR